jgi:hypothetical protein
MKEKYSCYEYAVIEDPHGCGWYYEIYTDDVDYINWMRTNILIESNEWFESAQRARYAAIGNIDLLENGEG